MPVASETRGPANLAELLADPETVPSASFDAVYRYYQPVLVRYARKQGAIDPEGIADLALFDGRRVIDSLERRTESSFRAYVFRAARSHLVAEARRRSPEALGLDNLEIPAEGSDTDVLVTRMWLGSLIEQLPPAQRDVIQCRFVDDMSAAATSRRLDKSPNAVNQLQHRALRRLRRLALATAVAALLAAALWALSQIGAPDRSIDNKPAEPVPEPARVLDVELGQAERTRPTIPQAGAAEQADTSPATTPAAALGQAERIDPTTPQAGTAQQVEGGGAVSNSLPASIDGPQDEATKNGSKGQNRQAKAERKAAKALRKAERNAAKAAAKSQGPSVE